MDKFHEFTQMVETLKTDAIKFYEKENNKAGTRLRKGLKAVSDAAKNLRKHVSEVRETRKTTTSTDSTSTTTES